MVAMLQFLFPQRLRLMSSFSPQASRNVAPGRIDRAHFEAATFPSVIELPIRFDDLDVLWHVNNVAIIALLQEARVQFNRAIASLALPEGLRTVVGAMMVEYGGELTYPGTAEVSTGILALGRTSYTFGQLIRQNGNAAVYAQITMVVADGNGSAAIPADVRSAIEKDCMIKC